MKCTSTLTINIELPTTFKKQFNQSEELKEGFLKMLTEDIIKVVNNHVKVVEVLDISGETVFTDM